MTRQEIIEKTSFEIVEGIAAKLFNDGLTTKNYTREQAISIIEKTCVPSKLRIILEEFEGVVLYHIGKMDGKHKTKQRVSSSAR